MNDKSIKKIYINTWYSDNFCPQVVGIRSKYYCTGVLSTLISNTNGIRCMNSCYQKYVINITTTYDAHHYLNILTLSEFYNITYNVKQPY